MRRGRRARRRLRREGDARRARGRARRSARARRRRPRRGRVPPLRLRAPALQLQHRPRRGVLERWRPRPALRESAPSSTATRSTRSSAAREGIYDIRGFGAKRAVPHFDDLVFLGASMSRYPLEGYRERCDTDVVLGDRHAKKPLHRHPDHDRRHELRALSAPAKEAPTPRRELGRDEHDDRRRRHDARGARAPRSCSCTSCCPRVTG